MGNVCGADKRVIASRQPRHINEDATKFYKGDEHVLEDDRFVRVIEGVRKNSKKNNGLPERFFIKTVKAKKYVTKERFESIRQDMEILCKLDHPNIIKYYDFAGNHKKFHVVTEYHPGKTLKQFRIDSPITLSERLVGKIAKQLLDAMSYCNEQKLSHRNLTPDNILIDDAFNVKIINFEQSKIDVNEKNLQKKDGSSSYTAPE